jgi:hypothetical protein
MTTFEELPSVKTAVQREAQRRKRVYGMFALLLLVPVAIGIYAIAKAPSETDVVVEKVVKDVTPIVQGNIQENLAKNVEATVTERVDRQIEPRVQEAVERRAAPLIERTLTRQVDAAVTARVRPLEQQYRAFTVEGNTEHERTAARVKELEARVAALERRLAALTGPRPVNPNLQRERLEVKPVTPAKPPG